jgi:chromodomain-helicase-DNA-binding protein 7
MMYSLQMEHILLMTRTPIQNNVEEIFALLHFIAPRQLPSVDGFRAKHSSIKNADNMADLQNALKSYVLRRQKGDVEQSIAAKEETIVEVKLTRAQKLYRRMLIDFKSEDLTAGQSHVKARALNNLAMQLRKVCNHPFLLPDAEAEVIRPGQDPIEAMASASGKLVSLTNCSRSSARRAQRFSSFHRWSECSTYSRTSVATAAMPTSAWTVASSAQSSSFHPPIQRPRVARPRLPALHKGGRR